MLPEIVCKFQ
jgi:hypothetical protein